MGCPGNIARAPPDPRPAFRLPPRPAHARPAPVSFSSVPCVVSSSMGDCTKRNFGPFYRVRNVRILADFVQAPGPLGSSYVLFVVADNMPVSFPDTENSRALFLGAYISGYSLLQRSQRRPRPQIAAFLLWSIKYASVLVSPRKGAFCAHRAAPVPLLASVPLGCSPRTSHARRTSRARSSAPVPSLVLAAPVLWFLFASFLRVSCSLFRWSDRLCQKRNFRNEILNTPPA
jgi:hypothetical protein